jgi:hypothetical protein
MTLEELAELRAIATTVALCCSDHAERMCARCRVFRAVDDLVIEVEATRAGTPRPPPPPPRPEHAHPLEVIADTARALVAELGPHTPLTPGAHILAQELRDLLVELDEVERYERVS